MYPFPYNVYNQGYNQRVPFIIPRPYVDDFIDLRQSNERPYKIASTGLCLNAWNLFYYRRDPRSITYFIRARIVSDMIVSTIFLTYTMPVILFALNDVHSGYWNRISDLFSSWSYTYIVYLEPFVAINRLIAIFFPASYEKLFSKTVTKICLILVWLISSSAIWGDTFGEDCVYSFDYTWLSWSYPSSPCGKFAQTYAFLLPAYICNFVTFIINIVICFRLILMKFYLKHTGSQIIKRHNIHARFFIQSGLQFLVFTIDLCMNTFFDEPDDRLITFFYYSLIWMSLHTIDGLIICCFRSKIERRKLEWTPNRIFSTVNNSAIPNHS